MTLGGPISKDEQLLQKLRQIVLNNIQNEQFGVEELARSYGISRSQLHRKLKKIKGKSISQFIKEIRLNEALILLQQDVGTASEIAYLVGFSSPNYFNTCFKKYFGYTPGEALLRKDLRTQFNHEQLKNNSTVKERSLNKYQWPVLFISVFVMLIAGILGFKYSENTQTKSQDEDSLSEELIPVAIPERSVAVLPFEDMSSNRDQEYFTEAMVVEINNHLVKIEDLLVTSRISTLDYKESSKSIKEIATELGVATILTGNVQREGDLIRVTAQLIDGGSNHFLWSESYEAELASVFAIQSEIAQKVAEELKIQLTPELHKRIDDPPTDNIEAYNLFLEVKSGQHDLETDINILTEVIELDKNFADAYVEMVLRKLFYIDRNVLSEKIIDDFLVECTELLNKAIELDPDNAAAHRILASTYLWHLYDFEKADFYFNKAIALNPSMAMSMYPFYLIPAGRFEEALKYNTFQILPAYPNNYGHWLAQALCYYYLEKSENVEQSLKKAFEKDSIATAKHHGYFMISCYQGNYKTIVLNFENFDAEEHVKPRHLGMAAIAYLNLDTREKAENLLKELENISDISATGSPAYFAAAVYAEREEPDKALKWLKRSYQKREFEMIWLNVDPLWESLREEKGFKALSKKMGF